MNDEVTDLEWFLLELDRLDDAEFTRSRVAAIVRSFAGRRVYFAKSTLIRPESVKVALALIEAGCCVAATRDRLVDGGYCNSQDTAYRIVREAVDKRGKALAVQRAKSQADFFGAVPT